MRRILLASALLALTLCPTFAQDDCQLKDNYCVPVVGCIIDSGELVLGRSYGKREGPVLAILPSGTSCLGTWKRTIIGTGRAQFVCEDGRSGRITYNFFDTTSGTASGKGRLSSGETLRFWSGHNILALFLSGSKTIDDADACVKTFMKSG